MTLVVPSIGGGVSFINDSSHERLRDLLVHALRHFTTYADHFAGCGFDEATLLVRSQSCFEALPAVDKTFYGRLQEESYANQSEAGFVIDPSSGTTGTPVLKFTSKEDDAAEAAAVRAGFARFAIGPADSSACLDIGASQIYLFYMRVLRDLGSPMPVFLKLAGDQSLLARRLSRLNPDVLVTIPSVLRRCRDSLTAEFARVPPKPRRVICIGEPLDSSVRRLAAEAMGAECFSFYGTTEIGSVAMECGAHAGMHIPTDLFIPTLSPWPDATSPVHVSSSRYRGTVAWTALRITGQPTIKYSVRDLVEIDVSPCPCGDLSPRLFFQHRVDEAFFLYGITFTYDFFRDIVDSAGAPWSELALHVEPATGNGRDRVTLFLDKAAEACGASVYQALANAHPLSELLWSGLAELSLEFRDVSALHTRRKTRQVTWRHP